MSKVTSDSRWPPPSHAALAAVALAACTFLLLDTTSLEPLRWDAATLGIWLLLVAALGAGLLSGLRFRTILLVFVVPVVFLAHPAPTLIAAFGQSEEVESSALKLLWLVPVAVAVGAVGSRFSTRTSLVGAALLVVPVIVVAWAGFRQARPVDHVPPHPLLIRWKGVASYRGVKATDTKSQVIEALGAPVRVSDDGGLVYGQDTIDLASPRDVEVFSISDPRAQTPEGVGIGDSLALVRRLPGELRCPHNPDTLKAECRLILGNTFWIFENDPITEILLWPNG